MVPTGEEKEQWLGRLVSSSAGRDRGHYYLVFEVLSDRFVRVVDGVVRGVERPKEKNVKHLWFHPERAEGVAEKLMRGERVTNAEIRQALDRLKRE
ncbi:MAG: KOW domain-containing RNA-binding protein [Firmicutes bacterium]|nr:KOW domain-containing RNA-binding protein [Bacillota bacterium]